MMRWFIATAFSVLAACSSAAGPKNSVAAERTPAEVMSWRGADWLTRDTRIDEEQPDKMLAALDIKPGDVVADIGAGVGYHVMKLSPMVGPTGQVIGEDIQPEMIVMLQKNVAALGLTNVRAVQGKEDDPLLPLAGVDLILMVDVYHEFANPRAMLQKFRKALKPNGRLVLVEYRGEDPNVPIRAEHKMTLMQVRAELEPAGFLFQQSLEFLPWQHLIIFTSP
jgi:ubiquinone/menaquinone biosynthesis C-methylase UbiE